MLRNLFAALLERLKHEPVTVWGVVIAAVLCLLPAVGIPAGVITAISTVATLAGIPLVRGQVSPMTALRALALGDVASSAADDVDEAPVDEAPITALSPEPGVTVEGDAAA
jgi:hypothetical protein